MEKYEDVVGIDLSKLTIDAHLYKRGLHRLFSNTYKGYVALIKWTERHLKDSGYFFCFEDTGHYSTNLAVFMSENAIDYIEENPLAIKPSSGIVRGKTDRLDAAMIARYAWIHKEELKLSSPKETYLQEL